MLIPLSISLRFLGPVTVAGRVFTSFYVMAGVGIIGVAVGIVGGYVMEQQVSFVQYFLVSPLPRVVLKN